MNRTEYLTELRQRLNPLPLSCEDIDDALQYYREYFDEAGPEREGDVITELGSPAYVAAQIALKLSDSSEPLSERKIKTAKSRPRMMGMILLGVAAAPVALPLALAAAAVVFSLIFAAFSVFVSFGAGGIACIAAGASAIVGSLMIFTTDFASALFFMGTGLFSIGVGGFIMKLGVIIGKVCYKAIKWIGRRLLKKDSVPAYAPVIENKEVIKDAREN